jgi:hypothetical protein
VASLASALIVQGFLKSDFFTQPFLLKAIILSSQIFALCALYVAFLFAMGERSAVNALLNKISSRFQKK